MSRPPALTKADIRLIKADIKKIVASEEARIQLKEAYERGQSVGEKMKAASLCNLSFMRQPITF